MKVVVAVDDITFFRVLSRVPLALPVPTWIALAEPVAGTLPAKKSAKMSVMSEDQKDGLLTPGLIPKFTVLDLLGITTLLAVGLAICPLLPTWVDGALLMYTVVTLAIGVLYRPFIDLALSAMVIGVIIAGVTLCVFLN